MADPNTYIALMAFPTYYTLAPGHKNAWLTYLECLRPTIIKCFKDREVFASKKDYCLYLNN